MAIYNLQAIVTCGFPPPPLAKSINEINYLVHLTPAGYARAYVPFRAPVSAGNAYPMAFTGFVGVLKLLIQYVEWRSIFAEADRLQSGHHADGIYLASQDTLHPLERQFRLCR